MKLSTELQNGNLFRVRALSYRERVAEGPGEGGHTETFRPACHHPARRATFSRGEKDSPQTFLY
jgi:hypothetical protein